MVIEINPVNIAVAGRPTHRFSKFGFFKPKELIEVVQWNYALKHKIAVQMVFRLYNLGDGCLKIPLRKAVVESTNYLGFHAFTKVKTRTADKAWRRNINVFTLFAYDGVHNRVVRLFSVKLFQLVLIFLIGLVDKSVGACQGGLFSAIKRIGSHNTGYRGKAKSSGRNITFPR